MIRRLLILVTFLLVAVICALFVLVALMFPGL